VIVEEAMNLSQYQNRDIIISCLKKGKSLRNFSKVSTPLITEEMKVENENLIDQAYQDHVRANMEKGIFSTEHNHSYREYLYETMLAEALSGVDFFSRQEVLKLLEEKPAKITLREIINGTFSDVLRISDEFSTVPMWAWLQALEGYPIEALREIGALIGSPALPSETEIAIPFLAYECYNAEPADIIYKLAAVTAFGVADDYSLNGHLESLKDLKETLVDAALPFCENNTILEQIATHAIASFDFSNHF
tara:strand:+ start:445 stop:1194 length:750 start_codon:yes stop_codon:yes gene_type:complete